MSSSIDKSQSATAVENSTIPNIVVRSNIQWQDKIQTQKIVSSANTDIIGFSKPYLFSVSGILRLLLIVSNLNALFNLIKI
jgi:hypothetical protein